MSASASHYCQCGKRLARDHVGPQCGACERRAVQQRVEPPAVSVGFWHTPAFRDAFDAQHMGHVARAYRRHPLNVARYGRDGIPQELLGAWLGLTQAQVSRIENGPPIRNLDTLTHWARVLHIPSELLWFKFPGERAPFARPIRLTTGMPSAPPMPVPPSASFQVVPVSTGALRNPDAAAMQAFRSADLQVVSNR